jgi:hypothetical protein
MFGTESWTLPRSAQLRANTALLRVRLIISLPAARPMLKSVRRQQSTPHKPLTFTGRPGKPVIP